MKGKKWNKWSREEIEALKLGYPVLEAEKIAWILDRSTDSVYSKANELKITKRQRYIDILLKRLYERTRRSRAEEPVQ